MFNFSDELGMMTMNLDVVQTIAFTTVILLIGQFLRNKVNIFNKYCIPAPVIGGFLFAILALILRQANVISISFDVALQNLLMTAFFTTVGFMASLNVLKTGGYKVAVFLAISIVLVFLQNIVGIVGSNLLGINPLMGLVSGSISMVGGHGSSGAFGPIIEANGLSGGLTIAMACATFGLVSGSIVGGPLAKKLIEKHNLAAEIGSSLGSSQEDISYCADGTSNVTIEEYNETPTNDISLSETKLAKAAVQIIIAMGIGTIISKGFDILGLVMPSYIGAMLAAAVMRNISDGTKVWDTPENELNALGSISLSLFLAMAMSTLKLWELIDLAIPIIILLSLQVILMVLFAYFVTFRAMGKDYTAAVLAAGNCGFGMGATSNGIANMQSVTSKYGPCPSAFFILPIVGSLFIDFINSTVITLFINFL